MTTVRVTDDLDQAGIEAAIVILRGKAKRMPEAWVDKRQDIADEIDTLVDRWIALGLEPA